MSDGRNRGDGMASLSGRYRKYAFGNRISIVYLMNKQKYYDSTSNGDKTSSC